MVKLKIYTVGTSGIDKQNLNKNDEFLFEQNLYFFNRFHFLDNP